MFKRIIRYTIKLLFLAFPVKPNKIVINDLRGRDYGGNPRYISEELQRRNLNLDIVWLLEDISIKLPTGIRKVRYDSLRSYYELATARVIIQSTRTVICRKKKSQTYLQTWHAPLGCKLVEGQAEEKLDEAYVRGAKYDGKITDGIIVDDESQAQIFQKFFWLNPNAEILRFGLPRNDVLLKYKNNLRKKASIRRALNLESKTFLILYAPTFRDHENTSAFVTDFDKIRSSFEEKMHRQCKILIRLHPNVAHLSEQVFRPNEYVIDVSQYPDTQELSLACDAVISDYSSIISDFLLLDKPVFLYMNDLEKYKKERGMQKAYFDVPAPHAKTMDELIAAIKDFDNQTYKSNLKDYRTKNPSYNYGDASSKTVDWILSKSGIGKTTNATG